MRKLLIFLLGIIPLVTISSGIVYASSTETTIYLSSIEKNLETGDQRIYYGAGNASVVRTVSQSGSSSVFYLHPDYLGSTVLLTNKDQHSLTFIKYYPYGNETEKPATTLALTKTDKFYTGQRKDTSSDLYFYNARYYNPKMGHFISADKAEGPNRYAYVGNNPIMRNDPSGNMFIEDSGGGGGGNTRRELFTNSWGEKMTFWDFLIFNLPKMFTSPSQRGTFDKFMDDRLADFLEGAEEPIFTINKGQKNEMSLKWGDVTMYMGMTNLSGPGQYTLSLIKAGGVPVRYGKISNFAECWYWSREVVATPGYVHRGIVYHEVWGHYWDQFMKIARGNANLFAKMYAYNPSYFEALAYGNTYKFLLAYGGSQEEINLMYKGWTYFYDAWKASGARIPVWGY